MESASASAALQAVAVAAMAEQAVAAGQAVVAAALRSETSLHCLRPRAHRRGGAREAKWSSCWRSDGCPTALPSPLH